jgi:hypothetical protein
MLRPTRFLAVTETDIVPALRRCNLMKTKSFSVQIVGISQFCILESNQALANAWAIGMVAGSSGFLDKCCERTARL